MDGDVSALGEARDHDVPGWYTSMDQAFDLGNHDAGILIYVGIRGALRRNDRGAPSGKCFEDGGVVIQAETRVSRAGPEILDDPAMQVYEICLSGVGNGGRTAAGCCAKTGVATTPNSKANQAFMRSPGASYCLAGSISYPVGGSAPSRCRTK